MSGAQRASREHKIQRPERAKREGAPIQPSLPGYSVDGVDLLHLQRTIGNQAVTRLVAPSVHRDQEGEEEADEPMQCGPAPPQLVGLAKLLIQYGKHAKDRKRPRLVKDMTEFLETGELPVISLRAAIMRQPQFLGRRVALLKRGYMVRVLYKRGPWLRVEYGGKQGWLHYTRLFPRIIKLRSGATGSGTTRGEIEIAGRA